MDYPGEWRDTGKGYKTRMVKSKTKTKQPTGRGTGQAGKAARQIKKSADRAKKY